MSSNYNIKYSSMDQLMTTMVTRTNNWYEQLEQWQSDYTVMINMNSFAGQSAEAAKVYLGEVHEFLLQSIYIAISRFQSEYLLYKEGYYDIDENIYASLPKSKITSAKSRIETELSWLDSISSSISSSLNSVSDIYYNGKPSKDTLENCLLYEKQALTDLDSKIEDYENSSYSSANGDLRSLLETLRSTLITYANSSNSIASYRSGDLCIQSQVLELYSKMQDSLKYLEEHQDAVAVASEHQQEVYEQMQADYEAACDERADEGWMKVIIGVGAAVIGGAAIVLTAGAATPVVAVAVVSGTCSMAYGVSNITEGGQDIYYASEGLLDRTSINPIRDTIFQGNQSAYDLWGSLSMAVAGMCIPVSRAINGVAGSSTSVMVQEAAKTIGKEIVLDQAVGFVSGNLSEFAANQLDLNKSQTLLLNMGLEFLLDKGVDAIETKVTGGSSFAESMSYEDAVRYNEYWNSVEAGTYTPFSNLTDADVTAWALADSKIIIGTDTSGTIAGNQSAILSSFDAEEYAFSAIKGSDGADSVVLGKYEVGSSSSYDAVARNIDAQYYNLSNWDELSAEYSIDEMWKINEKFLDIETSSGREIYLSHDPALYANDGSFFSRELQYLINNGYSFVKEGNLWHAIR